MKRFKWSLLVFLKYLYPSMNAPRECQCSKDGCDGIILMIFVMTVNEADQKKSNPRYLQPCQGNNRFKPGNF